MGTGQIVSGSVFLALAIGAFVISCFQFQEKGYLFNNAYLWASKEERKKMDENKATKRPHYRQSGFVFMFLGIHLLTLAAYIVTEWTGLRIVFWAFIAVTLVYAVASSIKAEQRK